MYLDTLKELCEKLNNTNSQCTYGMISKDLADSVPLLIKVIENMASDLQLLDKCYKMYEADSDSQDLVVQAVRIPLEITMAETIKAYFDKAEKEIKDEN